MSAKSSERPNLFVVGDAKCGTTSLHRLFELAPGIGTARTRKELHFFSAPELVSRVEGPGDETIPRAIIQDEGEYLSEYQDLGEGLAAIADVSPSYLQNPPAAARIKAFAPEARIIILLREPAAKVFSQYVHLWGEGREKLPFPDAYGRSAERRALGYSDMFDYEAGGFYAEAVARYLDFFGRDRVLVLLFEDMLRNWLETKVQLERFIGAELPESSLPRMNAGGRPRSALAASLLGSEVLKAPLRALLPLGMRTRFSERVRGAVASEKPVLDPNMQHRLRRHYAADAAHLAALLGRQTGWPAE
jgi:hypothetical protein